MKSRIGFSFSKFTGKGFRTYNSLLDKVNDWELTCACSADVVEAVDLAWDAWLTFRFSSLSSRVKLLHRIADLLEENREKLIAVYCAECNLSVERANNELNRTKKQLILMADFLEADFSSFESSGVYETKTLKREWVGIGPVAVFGASNFPFAYSTIGGDTVAALAAGCPVIVKAHPYHAGTSWEVSEVVNLALKELGFPDGCFSHLLDDGIQIGKQLVQDPKVKAVGFTGSVVGGEAILKYSNERTHPIPVFAEMGSINPVVILDSALKDGEKWIDLLTQSISNDGGQFCTKPGLILIPNSKVGKEFGALLTEKVTQQSPKVFVHPNVYDGFKARVEACFSWVEAPKYHAQPVVQTLSIEKWASDKKYRDEFFGPQSIILYYNNDIDLSLIFNKLEGQLTFTILGDYQDDYFREIEEVAISLAGRVVLNDVPTGVVVAPEMVHGGTYPAASDARFTAVGPSGVYRFLRPIVRQGWW